MVRIPTVARAWRATRATTATRVSFKKQTRQDTQCHDDRYVVNAW